MDADDVESALLASPESKAKPPENPCQQIESNGNIFTAYLNYVIEMFLKQLDDSRCIEELFKESCLKDHQDNIKIIFLSF